ncbi:hypothetical protein LTR56_020327 [Elasticomyces elasticus]|nr:hypothetical protein LTR56_020327 [Elasticomyces elasticus]
MDKFADRSSLAWSKANSIGSNAGSQGEELFAAVSLAAQRHMNSTSVRLILKAERLLIDAAICARSKTESGKKTDAATSGDNASAFSSSTDGKGGRETTTSHSKDGKTIVEKIFGGSGEKSKDSVSVGDEKSGAYASAGGGSFASSGKGSASAGIVDGKAVSHAN